jgi:hypothetical protein
MKRESRKPKDDPDELPAALIECIADGLPNHDADLIPLPSQDDPDD